LRRFVTLLTLSLLVVSGVIYSNTMTTSASEEISDVDILVLISDGCGWNYFVVNETLHEMGVDVTTITNTESYIVPACPNREPRNITADLLLSELDLETITDFDGVIIPSGGQWELLSNDSDVYEFLQVAYENGLVIGTICNADITLGRAMVVITGTRITPPLPNAYYNFTDCGAVIEWDGIVVSDNGFVTGGLGGAPAGYLTAPTYEVCLEMVKKIMDYSYLDHAEVTPETSRTSFNYSIAVECSNLTAVLSGFNISDIAQVTAYIYPESNSSDVTEVELVYAEATDQYQGSFTVSSTGNYIVDVDFVNDEDTFEIVRNVTTFTVGPQMSEISLGILALAGGVGVVVIVGVVLWRKKS